MCALCLLGLDCLACWLGLAWNGGGSKTKVNGRAPNDKGTPARPQLAGSCWLAGWLLDTNKILHTNSTYEKSQLMRPHCTPDLAQMKQRMSEAEQEKAK